MNKDVIYIDVEDDITAIIGKVNASREKIVALVPPKRIGILQSAVNLRLLQRAAGQDKKHLVLISNNQALSALAAAAQIPVARNLQSKPEVPEIAALSVDDDDDIIDGAQLPIGELARTSDDTAGSALSTAANSAIDAAVGANAAEEAKLARPPIAGQAPARARVKSGVKVPNFNRFRKKLLLIGAGLVVVVAFLVWAIAFAPKATVVITARTTNSSMNAAVALDTANQTDLASKTLHATVQQLKKDVSLPITATGSKNVGDKATGSIKFTTSSPNSTTVPAGTQFVVSGSTFTLDSAVTVPGATLSFGCGGICPSNASGAITAIQGGASYNGAQGPASGAPAGVSATVSPATSGGTDKTATVVTKDDIQKAADQLNSQDTTGIKSQLAKQFTGSAVTIDQSFKVDTSGVAASPAVDQEAPDGKAVYAGSVTYSLTGVSKNETDQYLSAYYAAQLKGETNQRVYDNGAGNVSFTNVAATSGGYSATMVATAKIGPSIDDTAIKNAARGKNFGDIQSTIEAIQGVDNVDVKFSPFWVSKAPDDIKRITVEFNLNGK